MVLSRGRAGGLEAEVETEVEAAAEVETEAEDIKEMTKEVGAADLGETTKEEVLRIFLTKVRLSCLSLVPVR